jgi:cytochrome c biogenesis protein CcmG, thiol:disulfide interchange protein DsbE
MTTHGRRRILAVILILGASFFAFRRVVVSRALHSRISQPEPAVPPTKPQSIAPGEVGAIVPELNLIDIQGKPIAPETLQGRVLLLDYWAPWCQPCEKEMPGYQRLQQKYGARGLVVIGVVFDPGMSMGDETADHFAKRLRITYPLVKDSPALQAQFGGILGIPTTFLVDRNRVIRYKIVGFEYTVAIEKALQPLL